MPDITMCANDACPSRKFCRRSEASGTVPTKGRQSYAHFLFDEESGACDHYWRILQDEPFSVSDMESLERGLKESREGKVTEMDFSMYADEELEGDR